MATSDGLIEPCHHHALQHVLAALARGNGSHLTRPFACTSIALCRHTVLHLASKHLLEYLTDGTQCNAMTRDDQPDGTVTAGHWPCTPCYTHMTCAPLLDVLSLSLAALCSRSIPLLSKQPAFCGKEFFTNYVWLAQEHLACLGIPPIVSAWHEMNGASGATPAPLCTTHHQMGLAGTSAPRMPRTALGIPSTVIA